MDIRWQGSIKIMGIFQKNRPFLLIDYLPGVVLVPSDLNNHENKYLNIYAIAVKTFPKYVHLNGLAMVSLK